jgi:MFS family permease
MLRRKDAATATGSEGDPASRGAYKWYVLGILVLINITGAVDRTVVSVIAEPLKAAFHLDDKLIGLLGGLAYSLTYALAVLPMGWLVDRVDRRALLSVGVMMWSALTAVCSMSGSLVMLVAARMGVGAAEAPLSPASLSLVADTFPLKQRNTAVSIYTAGGGGGAILQFIFGGWVLMHFGWRTVFLVAGGPGLLLGALLFFTTREPERGVFDTDRGVGSKELGVDPHRKIADSMRAMLRNTPLLYGILAITIGTGVIYSLSVWATSFLVRVHGMSVSHGAIWTGVGFGAGMMIGSLLVGPFADWYSNGDQRKLTLIPAVTTAIAVVAGAAMSLANTLVVALAGLSMMSLMAGFFIAPGYSVIISLAAPNERGTTVAATRLISILIGSGLIPLMTGAISDAVGGANSMRPALLFTTALLLVCTFCYVMILRTSWGRKSKAGIVPTAA